METLAIAKNPASHGMTLWNSSASAPLCLSSWRPWCSWRFASDCEGLVVTALYLISLVIAIALLLYLFMALLRPEWFG
jgi:K+-transporting ATPase KdpF subunit